MRGTKTHLRADQNIMRYVFTSRSASIMKTHQKEWFARLWKHRCPTRQCCSNSRRIAEPYEHQIRWTWLLVYFTNCWFTGIFKTSQSSRGFKRENEHPCLCCRCRQRLQRLPVLSKQELKMMTACLVPMGNRLAPSWSSEQDLDGSFSWRIWNQCHPAALRALLNSVMCSTSSHYRSNCWRDRRRR